MTDELIWQGAILYILHTRRSASAIADCTARRVWNVKRACFVVGVGAFRPKFYGTGSSTAKMLIPFDRQLIALQLSRWKFLDNETLYQTFNIFCRNFCEKRQIWVSAWSPFWEKSGVTHDLGWWLIGKPMVVFLLTLINSFRYLLWFRSYEAKCVQFGCFAGGRPLCTQILPGQGRPHQSFLASEN